MVTASPKKRIFMIDNGGTAYTIPQNHTVTIMLPDVDIDYDQLSTYMRFRLSTTEVLGPGRFRLGR